MMFLLLTRVFGFRGANRILGWFGMKVSLTVTPKGRLYMQAFDLCESMGMKPREIPDELFRSKFPFADPKILNEVIHELRNDDSEEA